MTADTPSRLELLRLLSMTREDALLAGCLEQWRAAQDARRRRILQRASDPGVA